MFVSCMLLALYLGPFLVPGDEPPATRDTLIVLAKSGRAAVLIDADTGQERLRLPTGKGPHEVTVSPDGTLAVVANYGTSEGGRFVSGNTLTVLDLKDAKVARTLTLEGYENPHGVQFLPDGERLLVTSEAARALLVVSVADGRVLAAHDTDADTSHMVVASPDGTRAYVANIGSGSVSVIDLSDGKLLAQLDTGAGCEGLDLSPDGKWLWSTNRAAGTLSVIDTGALMVTGEVVCPGFPIRVKFTPDGKRVVVSCARSSEVRIFDAATHRLRATIPIELDVVDDAGERLFGDAMADSPTPVGVLIAPDGKRAWIAATNADALVTLDLERLAVVGGMRVGPEPDGLAFARMALPPGD